MFRSFVLPILLIVSLPVVAGRLFDLPESADWTLNVSASLAVGLVALMLMRCVRLNHPRRTYGSRVGPRKLPRSARRRRDRAAGGARRRHRKDRHG
jgi:hypothetical protein